MSADLLGTHRPGTSVLHRTPAGAKLLGLVAASVLLTVVHGWRSGVAGLGVALLLAAVGRVPAGGLLRSLRGLLVVVALLGAWLTRQSGWPRAVETVADLLALVVLAVVVTTTTSTDAILDALTRALGPLRPLGVDPQRVALAFSLVLRTIPLTAATAAQTRDAARARGLERDLRAHLVPFALRVVADAQATGEALHARGIGDDDPPAG